MVLRGTCRPCWAWHVHAFAIPIGPQTLPTSQTPQLPCSMFYHGGEKAEGNPYGHAEPTQSRDAIGAIVHQTRACLLGAAAADTDRVHYL